MPMIAPALNADCDSRAISTVTFEQESAFTPRTTTHRLAAAQELKSFLGGMCMLRLVVRTSLWQ